MLKTSSGSVIGPLVTAELLRRKLPTVCIIVGSTTSAIETDNSIKTLRTLQAMATTGKTGGRAIPIMYFENENGGTGAMEYMGERETVDIRIEKAIQQLALLFSGGHRELDRTDLINWLDHSKVTPDIPPQLVEVLINNGDNKELEAFRGTVIGTASLLNNDSDPVIQLDQPYSCVGYLNQDTLEYADIPNHTYITTNSRTHHIFKNLTEVASVYKSTRDDLKSGELAGLPMSDENDTGMIL